MQTIKLEVEQEHIHILAKMAKRFTRTAAMEFSESYEQAAQLMVAMYELQIQLENLE